MKAQEGGQALRRAEALVPAPVSESRRGPPNAPQKEEPRGEACQAGRLAAAARGLCRQAFTHNLRHRSERREACLARRWRGLSNTRAPEFLVAGFFCRVDFHDVASGKQRLFLRVDEGSYHSGTFKPIRIWNGDQTDYGLNFTSERQVHVKVGTC